MNMLKLLENYKSSVLYLSAVSAATAVLGMVVNYAYNIFMARSIPLDEYGKLSIAIAIISVLSIPNASFSTFFTREFSKIPELPGKIAFVATKYSKRLFLAFATLSTLIAILLLLAGNPEAVIVIFALPAAYAALPLFSILQAREDITALSCLNLLGNMLKLTLGVGLVLLGFGLFGASAAIAIPPLLVLFVTNLLLKKRLAVKHEPHPVNFRKPVMLMIAVMLLQGIFLYLDLFAIQFFFGNETTGIFNVAETTAKTTFFLSGAIVIAFFPKAAKLDFGQKGAFLNLFAQSAFFLVPPTLVFLSFPLEIISFFYGPKFTPAAQPFFLLALGFLLYSLFNILLSAMLSQHLEKRALLLNAVGLTVHFSLLYALVPSRGMEGAAISVIISSAVLLLGAMFVIADFVKSKRGNTHNA